jgi:hypothetical protein
MHNPDTIRTTSMWATALAMTQGVTLLAVMPPGGRFARCCFLLDNTGGLALKALDDFWTGNPLVPFRTLMDARNELLDRLKRAEQAPTKAARGA